MNMGMDPVSFIARELSQIVNRVFRQEDPVCIHAKIKGISDKHQKKPFCRNRYLSLLLESSF